MNTLLEDIEAVIIKHKESERKWSVVSQYHPKHGYPDRIYNSKFPSRKLAFEETLRQNLRYPMNIHYVIEVLN